MLLDFEPHPTGPRLPQKEGGEAAAPPVSRGLGERHEKRNATDFVFGGSPLPDTHLQCVRFKPPMCFWGCSRRHFTVLAAAIGRE